MSAGFFNGLLTEGCAAQLAPCIAAQLGRSEASPLPGPDRTEWRGGHRAVGAAGSRLASAAGHDGACPSDIGVRYRQGPRNFFLATEFARAGGNKP